MSANVTVGVSKFHPLIKSPRLGSYTVCGRYMPDSGTTGPTVRVQCGESKNSKYKYLIVQFETTDYVGLCEVEAYATKGLLVNNI